MQMFSCLKVFVFLGIVLFLLLNTADVNAQVPSFIGPLPLGEDSVYAVGDIVEVVFIAAIFDEPIAPVSGARLIITHNGLTNVTISEGGTTGVSGEVIVRGTIADDTDVYIQAHWPDKGLTNRGELQVIKNVAKQTAQDVNAQVPFFIGPLPLGEDSVYAVGDIVEVVFIAAIFDKPGLPVSGARLIITHNGLTNVTISKGGTTDVSGEVIVRGTIADDTDVYIQAHWPDKGLTNRSELQVIKNVAKQTAEAEFVFDRYSNTFQHPDVHEHFPRVLRAFKNPEVQNVLNSVVINHFVRDPEYIRVFYPDINESIITLLATDNEFRTLFEDDGFQGVLQNPAEIDKLVRLIESQPQREPGTLTIVSGDLQKGEPQMALGNPLVVLVRDQHGEPFSNVNVAFRITKGSGRLSRTTARTGGTGQSETTLTFASEPGIHQVEASVVGFPSLTQTFTAASTGEVSPPPPEPSRVTGLSIVSGNNQSGEVGKPLAQPLVVGVLDQYGKPFAGIVVAFAVTLGGGQLSATRVMTDIYGQALTTLTLGSHVGRNLVTARAAGIIPQTFTATAIAPPKEPEPVEPERPSTDEPDQQLPPVVYWIEEGAIFRLDGGNKQALVEPSGGWTVTGLAMDMARNKLYWTERQTGKQMGSIWSGDLNDRNARKLQSITAVPKGIVVDAENDRLYWTNDRGKIQSINVNGSNFKGNFIKDLDSPKHIALGSGTLYWTAYDATADSWSIWFKRLGSSVTQKEIMRGLGELGGIAVDSDKLYWTEKVSDNQGKISSVSLNGSGAVTLSSLPGSVPLGLAVDEAGRRLYVTDNHGNIRSLNLDKPIEIEIVVRGSSDTPAVAIALGRSSDESIPASPAAPSTIAERSVESALLANYPNPFNPETWIPYQLSASADVSVSIYAVDGCLIRTLALGHQAAGIYQSRSRAAYWDGRNSFGERVASGLYFYTLTAGDFTATRKMLIRK